MLEFLHMIVFMPYLFIVPFVISFVGPTISIRRVHPWYRRLLINIGISVFFTALIYGACAALYYGYMLWSLLDLSISCGGCS